MAAGAIMKPQRLKRRRTARPKSRTVGLAAGRCKGPDGARLDAHLRQLLELASAVADLLGRHAQDIQERELQVRRRRVFWIDEMTAALEGAAATADDERRERTVCVTVTVADARSIQNDQVVEQRAIAVGRVAKLFQIVRK